MKRRKFITLTQRRRGVAAGGARTAGRTGAAGWRALDRRDHVPVRPQEFSDSHAATRKARSHNAMESVRPQRSNHTNLSMAARAIFRSNCYRDAQLPSPSPPVQFKAMPA
jgi:hypothetical protein